MSYSADFFSFLYVYKNRYFSSKFNVGDVLAARKAFEMNRSGPHVGPKRHMCTRKVLLYVLLGVLILSASLSVVWGVKARGTKHALVVIPPTPYVVHRSEEQPAFLTRAFSLAPSQAHTSLLPWATTFDYPHGFVWVAEPGCEPLPKCSSAFAGILGQYALSDGRFIRDYVEPAGYTSPLFLVVDKNGNLWFTQPTSDAIGEFDPYHNTWKQWSVARGSAPYGLLLDTHDNLWFTEFAGNAIGFLDTQTHKVVETPVPTHGSDPYGITLDSKGTIWFAENGLGVNQIGSFTPTLSGQVKITEYAIEGTRPHLITTDRAGNIWFSEGFDGDIAEFLPTSRQNILFRVYTGDCTSTSCPGSHISGIQADNKGNIWFSDSLSSRIGYLIPQTGQLVVQTLPRHSHPHDGLSLDSDGRVWCTEQDAFTLVMGSSLLAHPSQPPLFPGQSGALG